MIMRKLLLYLSTASWARHIAVRWQVARRVARRFVAGETLDEAIAVAKELEKKGIFATLDYLGESVAKAEDTVEVVETYKALLDRIHAEKLASSVSLKLTHIGFDISEDLCMTNLRHILTTAKIHHIPVTLDMESTAYTDATLRMYRTLRDEYEFHSIGTVIQAYLYRSEHDMQQLTAEGAHIRLCKGAYLEPPEVAFPEKSDVDKNYVKLAQHYLQNGQHAYLCLATHDENMIVAAEKFIAQQHIAKDRYEFQMLYGVRSQRQEELAKNHQMRVYVPFGSAWYPYFVRRLAERPANVWFFVKNITG